MAIAVTRGVPLVDRRRLRRRWDALLVAEKDRARYGAQYALHRHGPLKGRFMPASRPLEFVQIDHTQLNVVCVDPCDRSRVLGRPNLTVLVDVFSRVILGFTVSWLYPSSLLTAQAIARATNPKGRWLRTLGIEHLEWPFEGVPRCLHSDHGSDLTAQAVQRGCRFVGIEKLLRRGGYPEDGGHVERSFRTIHAEIQDLPGTTFAHAFARAVYDSEGRAVLSLADVERVVAIEIDAYHRTEHGGTGYTPWEMWHKTEKYQAPFTPAPGEVLHAFMPFVTRRKIQRYGLQLDGRRYNGEALQPWINRTHPDGKDAAYLFVYEPRDPAQVFFFDPALAMHRAVPLSDLGLSDAARENLRVARRRGRGRRTPPEVTAVAFVAKQEIVATAKVAARADKRARRRQAANDILADTTIEATSQTVAIAPKPQPLLEGPVAPLPVMLIDPSRR